MCTCPPYAGRKLLESVLEAVSKHSSVARVYLHVQVGNDTALAFYESFRFVVTGTIPDYYKKISPSEAVVLEWSPPAPASA